MRKKTFLFCALILISYVAISLSGSMPAQIDKEGYFSFGEIIDVDIIKGLIVVKDMIRHEENVFSYSGRTYIYIVLSDIIFSKNKSWLDVIPGKYVDVFYIEGEFGERIARFIDVYSKEEKGIQIIPNE